MGQSFHWGIWTVLGMAAHPVNMFNATNLDT